MVNPGSFNLFFPNGYQYRKFYHVYISHLYILFHEASVQVFVNSLIGAFIFLLLSFENFLHILDV